MPVTLKQLENRRENCIQNIENFKTVVNDIGGKDFQPNWIFQRLD